MKKVMFKFSWNFDSGLRGRRVRALLLFAGFALFFAGPFAARRCAAQVTDDPEDQSYDQPASQSVDRQSQRISDQETGLTPDAASGRAPVQQPVRPQSPVPAQEVVQPTVSAEQLIGILEQEPAILESVRSLVVQRTGGDPNAITDEVVFERIRQDAGLREAVTKELIGRGYGANLLALNAGSTETTAQLPPYQNPD